MSQRFIVEADGGSRGNPGIAGSGAIVLDADNGQILYEIAEFIGVATNNVAEYRAVIAALRVISERVSAATVHVRMDSRLVIEQLSGNWKVKHPDMRALAIEAQTLLGRMNASFEWIPREQNSRADALANEAMDSQESVIRRVHDQTGGIQEQRVSSLQPGVSEFGASKPSSIRAPEPTSETVTTIVLVRHGRTTLTESNRISGRGGADPELSEAGLADASRVAEALAKFGKSGEFSHIAPPTVVVSSPILRTKQTAQKIAKALALEVEISEDFAEISFGDWDGLTHAEAKNADPDLFEQWRGSWTVAPPSGESLAALDERVIRGLESVLTRHAGETVVVVSHVMPIRGILRAALGANAEAYWRIIVAPTSISIARFWNREAAEVVTINSTNHFTSR